MPWSSIADRWAPLKTVVRDSLAEGNALASLSYGVTLLAGSLVGFGLLVGLGSPPGLAPKAAIHAPAHPSHAEPEHHDAAPAHHDAEAAHHDAAPEHHGEAHGDAHGEAHGEAHGGAHGHGHHAPDPLEKERAHMRDSFTENFISRFLSTDCAKNRHSENGVQFGANSYAEFTNSKLTRYFEGEYQFDPDGFKLITDESSRLDFKLAGDTLSMAAVMIGGVTVPAAGALTWKACHSDPHEPPVPAPTPTRTQPSDGLRLALAANDREAAVYYLTLGAYIPSTELANMAKSPAFEAAITEPIRGASRLNEDDAQQRQHENEALEARRKAEEAKRPKTAKPNTDGKEAEKAKTGEKPKEGAAHH